MADDKKKFLRTPLFRASFVHVDEPAETLNGDMAYSVQMLFPKKDVEKLKELKREAMKVAKEKFGENWSKIKGFKWPFRDGDKEKSDMISHKGMIFVNVKSKFKPAIFNGDREIVEDEGYFYSGCWGYASLGMPYAFDKKGGKGVGFTLRGVQKAKDDEPLASGGASADEFQSVEGFDSDSDNFGDDDF